MNIHPISAPVIWKAIKDQPSRYVYATDCAGKEWRIVNAKFSKGVVYVKALATGRWFQPHSWREGV